MGEGEMGGARGKGRGQAQAPGVLTLCVLVRACVRALPVVERVLLELSVGEERWSRRAVGSGYRLAAASWAPGCELTDCPFVIGAEEGPGRPELR
ncbi:hypothetical protein chiPu_0015807 [Chiloscyllium punctatum]|uniref:Uncharacterized protein n=1 Tax=Chiloscyllium punctatum TaxID=137246 RepID=A0A401T3W5_CHIPU|nr:hypothetical protein [Chiloscyllium punctatum]